MCRLLSDKLLSALIVILIGLLVSKTVDASPDSTGPLSKLFEWTQKAVDHLESNSGNELFVQAESNDEENFFWYNEITGDVSWTGPWREVKDENGKTYYVDNKTNEASWTYPTDWQETTSEGKTFYYNVETKVTQWEKPEALAWVKKDAKKYFWYNSNTKEKQWENPENVPLVSEEHGGREYWLVNGVPTWDKPHQWSSHIDEQSGKEFYVNSITGEKTWDVPTELAWQKLYIDYFESEINNSDLEL